MEEMRLVRKYFSRLSYCAFGLMLKNRRYVSSMINTILQSGQFLLSWGPGWFSVSEKQSSSERSQKIRIWH